MKISVFSFLLISFNVCAQQYGKIEYSRYSDSVPHSEINVTLSDSIYNYVQSTLTFIYFDDCNNCDARAHIMAAAIEKRFPGVNVSKAWMFAEYKLASMAEKYRFKKNNYLTSDEECSSWGYHVAPMIIFAHSNRKDTIVIDPSTQDAAVPLSKWMAVLLPKNESAYLIIKEKKYFSFPDDEYKKFEDMKEIWNDDENKQLLDEDYSISIRKIFTSRNVYWDPWTYRNYISEIKDLLK